MLLEETERRNFRALRSARDNNGGELETHWPLEAKRSMISDELTSGAADDISTCPKASWSLAAVVAGAHSSGDKYSMFRVQTGWSHPGIKLSVIGNNYITQA